MDPIDFWPSGVIDLMFQHLTGREILNATFVSTTWNEFIAQSTVCMKKIQLKILGRKFYLNGLEHQLANEVHQLSHSIRRYQNIAFYAHKQGHLTRDIINVLSTIGRWKNILICSAKFHDEAELEELLVPIELSIEYLDLRNLAFVASSIDYQLIKKHIFPMLKCLKIAIGTNCSFHQDIFQSCPRLTSLTIENYCTKSLIRVLQSCKTITDLTLISYDYNDGTFMSLISIRHLALKSFKLKINSTSLQGSSQKYLIDFLNSQNKNLETLNLDIKLSLEILDVVFKMFKLRKLCLKTLNDFQWELVKFTENSSITDLEVEMLKCSLDAAKVIFLALPKLEKFKTSQIAVDCLKFISDLKTFRIIL